jgi:ferredoxin
MSADRRILVVDRPLCQSFGQCEAVGPTLFVMDEDGVAVVLKQPVTPEEIELAEKAIRMCPRRAIRFDEAAPASGAKQGSDD